jgi:hypothetical protein
VPAVQVRLPAMTVRVEVDRMHVDPAPARSGPRRPSRHPPNDEPWPHPACPGPRSRLRRARPRLRRRRRHHALHPARRIPRSARARCGGVVGAQPVADLAAGGRGRQDLGAGGDSAESSAEVAAVRVWVSLHGGMVTLRASVPWFPWPPRGEVWITARPGMSGPMSPIRGPVPSPRRIPEEIFGAL